MNWANQDLTTEEVRIVFGQRYLGKIGLSYGRIILQTRAISGNTELV
jgi:hypothetical protein